jgi:4-amino-4-deoxy-L-arabinose transferase-like glycosyltransferase
VIFVAPDVWFGIDPFDWAHFLNGVAGVAVLAIVVTLGWRIRPAIGALAAVGYVAVPYLHDLTRTARLDVPTAALVLLYLVVGIHAVRRGSLRWGLAAGAVFAVAFLIKETILPFAPVPFLVGIIGGRPWAGIARLAAVVGAVAAIGTSWWFVMFAAQTRTVYRLGAPSGWLVPLYVGAALVVVAGFAAPWIAARPATLGIVGRARRRAPAVLGRHGRTLAGWGLAVAWFLALTYFFSRNPELKGNGLFRADQYALYFRTWLPSIVLIAGAGVGGLGVALSLVARRDASPVQRQGIDSLYLALLCGASLVLFVIATGEPPRNFLAHLGLLAVLSAVGWLWLIERLAAAVIGRVRGRSPASGEGRLGTGMLTGLLVAALVVGTGLIGSHVLGYRASASASARQTAVTTAAGWIRSNVPPGSRIGFGSFLGYETAAELPPQEYAMVSLHQQLAAADPTAPLGLRMSGQPPIDDWIAIEATRREQEFYVFRASVFADQVRRSKISIYVYHSGPVTSVPALLGALTPEHGFTELMSWTYPAGGVAADGTVPATHVFAVDQSRVGFEGSPMYATAGGLTRFVSVLEREPVSAATAANLVERIALWPDAASAGDALERLAALAGR